MRKRAGSTCYPPNGGCDRFAGSRPRRLSTFEAVVNDYIRCYRTHAEKDHRWFAIQKSLPDAIELAVMAVSPGGKRLHHQRRIPRAVLRTWADPP